MSFSSVVKNELSRIHVDDKCCLKAELASIIAVGGQMEIREPEGLKIGIITENAAFARRSYSLIKELYEVCPEVICRKSRKLKKHTVFILAIPDTSSIKKELDIPVKDACCKRAYLRGAFLAGGSISDPEKTYHLEIATRYSTLARQLRDTINSYNLNAKIIKRKGYYVVYLKEGDHIVDFLNIIGAHAALLELENIRILKDMRNNVNRIVNCETANLEKTVNASVRQVRNIEYIRDNMGFGNLPENLREIAELRLKYSDASLKELGEMLNPPLGKSGVNHRLRKLEEIAESMASQSGSQKCI
ncbi:MAG TPA: DNA-binding protein WhiA [Clostridiales bacterium]|nr:DNA-binding protein WhiA [Clostridiales bacterium]